MTKLQYRANERPSTRYCYSKYTHPSPVTFFIQQETRHFCQKRSRFAIFCSAMKSVSTCFQNTTVHIRSTYSLRWFTFVSWIFLKQYCLPTFDNCLHSVVIAFVWVLPCRPESFSFWSSLYCRSHTTSKKLFHDKIIFIRLRRVYLRSNISSEFSNTLEH